MKSIFRFLLPPPQWRLPAYLLLGILVGLGGAVFVVSNASSYLSDKPETCMNCHVMSPHFATWQRGSHGRAATCNDCHVPQDNFARTYFFKAQDGMRHAAVFTARTEPQVIRIKEAGADVVQENCIRCHKNQVHFVSIIEDSGEDAREGRGVFCWHCHREVPHGRVNSLASAPYARVPIPSDIAPSWMERLLQSGQNSGN